MYNNKLLLKITIFMIIFIPLNILLFLHALQKKREKKNPINIREKTGRWAEMQAKTVNFPVVSFNLQNFPAQNIR